LNFDNFNRSPICNFVANNLMVYPPMLGFGIPQRSYSYIMGRQKH
jgi:hypothetical protein